MQVTGGASITSKGNRVARLDRRSHHALGCQMFLPPDKIITDWVMGLHGPLDGYSPEWWISALEKSSVNASSSLPAESEQLAADRLQEFYPHCDSVRFMSDGTNPNEAAVRLARAATGRSVIAFCGYHGYGTSFPHNPDANDLHVDERRGIPPEMWQLTRQFEWGAPPMLDVPVAAFIVEVPPQDDLAPEILKSVREYAHRTGALFILDDVVTGFRVAPGGAAERYGVEADLYCIGKALGNGFNVSALVGRHEIMDLLTQGVHYSATFNGAGLATGMAAATLKWISENKATLYPTLYARGEQLKSQMNQVFEAYGLPVRMVGNATRPVLVNADDDWLDKWRDAMFARGFYVMEHPWYVTMAHTEDVIDATVRACAEACREIAQ